MSQRTWKGGATAVAQIWKASVTDITVGHTYILQLTDEAGGTASTTYTVTSGDTTTTILATDIAAALNASTDPRFMAITWSSNSNTVIGTANVAGVPFYVTGTTGTGTWTGTGNTTVNQGPNDWNTKANWVENVVPVNSDNVTITGSNAISYGLQTGLALGAFNVVQTASVKHGSQGLRLGFTCTSFYFAGSGLSYFDLGSSAIAPRIVGTASATAPACGLYIKGSALTTATVEGGSVDFVGLTGETATVATINVLNTARVRCGLGLTLTNLYHESTGSSEIGCAATTIIGNNGNVTTVGTGAVGTITCNGATVTSNSTGTVTTVTCNAGLVDFTQSDAARTVTNINVAAGEVDIDTSIVTVTNQINVTTRGPAKVTVAQA